MKTEVACLEKTKIPSSTINRLPRYLHVIEELARDNIEWVTSRTIGIMVNCAPEKVRYDFHCLDMLGKIGKRGQGYHVRTLRNTLWNLICQEKIQPMILLGLGNLGKSLVSGMDGLFEYCGFSLNAIFDIKPALIGTRFHGIEVLSFSMLHRYCTTHHVSVAILCVPADQAEIAADQLYLHDIEAIWNFTEASLAKYSRHMHIQNVNLTDSLLVLNYHLCHQDAQEQ